MNSKLLLFLGAVLLIGGIVFLTRGQTQTNQSSTKASPTIVVETPPTAAQKGKNTTTVEATSDGFNPKEVTVKVGTKVMWANKTGVAANVSSAKHPTHQLYPPLNLGDFADGQSVSLVFDTPGTYGYHDHLFPNKTGKVIVE